MKSLISSSLSALLLTTAAIPVLVPTAKAEMRFNFSAPFIADSGVADASGRTHFINVAVTGYPLTELMITLPRQAQEIEGVKVTNQMGKEVAAKVAVKTGSVVISFPQAVAPDDYLNLKLTGVEINSSEERLLYQVTAKKQGLNGSIPIGTAMILVSERSK